MSALVPHNPAWSKQAHALAQELSEACMGLASEIHHIGSTSVPGLPARPVIDLLIEIRDIDGFYSCRSAIETLGYEWMGEFGLPGRRYLRRDDPETGLREVQAHGFAAESPDITRHLAFRELLRWDEEARAAYAEAKHACIARHPDDHRAYGDCKSALIDRLEARALSSPALTGDLS